MTIQDRVYTNEEFLAYSRLPENADRNYELIHGVIVEMPSPSPLHGWIVAQIVFLLRLYLSEHNIGDAFGDANDVDLAPGFVFKPDASFFSREQLPALPDTFRISPDLAVEVVSPSNTETEMLFKVEKYIQYGSRLVWVVYPEKRVVVVYRPATDGGGLALQKLTADDTLTGEDVLPGFSTLVHKLFPELPSA